MIPFIIIPLIAARWKHHSLKPLFHTFDLLPLLAVELVHIFFQVSFWLGNTNFVKYSSFLQWAFILVLLLPILKRKLYVPAICGAGCTVAGSLLNRVVISANNGKMPVFPTLSQLTGYCTRELLVSGVDNLHVLMDNGSRLPFLGDYIDLGWCILSPGDVLNHMFISIIIYCTVVGANLKVGDE